MRRASRNSLKAKVETRRSGFIGEDAILERSPAKIDMRETAADEPASKEARTPASQVFPIHAGNVRVLDRQLCRDGGEKFLGSYRFEPFHPSNFFVEFRYKMLLAVYGSLN